MRTEADAHCESLRMTQPTPRQRATAATSRVLPGMPRTFKRIARSMARVSEQDQRNKQDLDLDVPRPLSGTPEPAPGESREEGADDRNDRQVDQLLRAGRNGSTRSRSTTSTSSHPPPMKAASVSMIRRFRSFCRKPRKGAFFISSEGSVPISEELIVSPVLGPPVWLG